MIRVVGGRWKGRRLEVPRGAGTRPSAARLREALFSSIADRVVGAEVVDLFAGSGALGIEGLSRGAARATFVEIDPRAVRVIAANLAALGADPAEFRVRRGDARRWLERQLETGDRADGDAVILLDPPWTEEITGQLLPLGRRLVESARCGAFVLEHPAGADLPEDLAGPTSPTIDVRTRRHGQGAFTSILLR